MIAAALALAAMPSHAAIPKHAPSPRPAASAADADAIVAAAMARARASDCAGVLALLDPLVDGPGAVSAAGSRVSVQMMRLPCLSPSGRGGEVAAVLTELKASAPTNPLVQDYQLFADVDGGRFAEAADGLGVLADQRSTALNLVPGDLWRAVSQQLTIQRDFTRRDRVALALAQAEWAPADRPDLPEALAADGVGTLIARKDVDEARDLLGRVHRPELLWQMAIERRYAPLWPDVETRIGPAGATAADRFARTALAAYAAGPADDRTTLDAARAFLVLGRLDDVAATAAPIVPRPGMSEDQVTTLLIAARARAAAGDRAGQMAMLNGLAALDPRSVPQAVGAVIALAEAYDETGRYDEELALARRVTAAKDQPYSAYGVAWLRRSEVCALSGLHRADEARAAGDALMASAGDNESAAIEGLLCAGRDGDAARIAIAALATPEGTDRIADQFQPSAALYAPMPSRLRALWSRLLARGEVKAAFEASAHILPRPLWPAAAPRPVPPLPGAPDPGSTV